MIMTKAEYVKRLESVRNKMKEDGVDLFVIYGDEFRRENLRYMTNYWPIFERGLLLVPLNRDPILLVSPECEHIARNDSIWQDIRLIRDVGMSYVPEEVDFTNVQFTTMGDVYQEVLADAKVRVYIAGLDAMCKDLYDRIVHSLGDRAEILNGDPILYAMRRIKSPLEIEALKKAWEICDIGYKAVLDADIVGLTEIQAAAIAEKAARDAGAESIIFALLTAGEQRTNIVVGRASEHRIKRGDMIMFALAVQYEGYIASDEWPFVAGAEPTEAQMKVIRSLVKAEDLGVKAIGNGVPQGSVVKMIREFFAENGLEQYDLYPPMHGNGLAEAESPYPDEKTTEPFLAGMGINFDVSLFGIPGVGSNRIEEGFIITEDDPLVLSQLISSLREEFLRDGK
jgi:Xaa-Pro aminopeptidase